MTLTAYSGFQAQGFLQTPLSDISIGGGRYAYMPKDDIAADISPIFDPSQQTLINWQFSLWIPNAAQNAPSYISAIDKSQLGTAQIISKGQAQDEFFVTHVSQLSNQYSFWLGDTLPFYPYTPSLPPVVGEVTQILPNTAPRGQRGDTLIVALQYGLEIDALLSVQYLAVVNFLDGTFAVSDIGAPGDDFA